MDTIYLMLVRRFRYSNFHLPPNDLGLHKYDAGPRCC
jgi:hypothetical protein